MAVVQVKNVSWWHESLADWMIANPHLKLGDAARYFQCTQTWISIIKNSDSFREYWQTRRGEVTAAITSNVTERACAVAEIALDRLAEKMETGGATMPVETLLDISNKSMQWLGYGAKGSAPAVQVNVGVSPEALARARELMNQKHNLKVEAPMLSEARKGASGSPSEASDRPAGFEARKGANTPQLLLEAD